ncbi:hypothetical protein EDD63_12920 [Breznakia blatticola]|uniref:Uncharacterized protein n=1 Tax=Breznakia blatticola TaxID=1754012 RepID=A0A4R7ZGB5_9FIRM|nr:hypothetical protein [Breznakia blatticola]TDW16076.1 hypothetical protein EDD63_12920 [Breznakia blatticola]
MSKPKIRDILKKKEIQEGKQANLEKGDFLAILIAAASVIIPVVLAVIFFFFIIIQLFLWMFG